MTKTILSVIGLVVIIAGAWYLVSSNNKTPMDTENVVAVVNGEEIMRTELETIKTQAAQQQGVDFASLDAETQSQVESQILDELIAQVLLRQAVTASGIVATEEDIDAQVATVVSQLGGQEAFGQALVTEGLSEEGFRSQVGADLAVQTYLEQELSLSSVTATNEEIEATYSQAAAQVTQGEEIPPLEEIRLQVEQTVVQQKRQIILAQFIETLKADADIEILL